jgi:squalene-associated FAD-dependent desaturase
VDRDEGGVDGVIVVIGGGWAGCAAAVELAKAGHRVELHEAGPTLGGRARGVHRDGLSLDNGEHLLLCAYTDTLDLVSTLHGNESQPPYASAPLALRSFGERARHRLAFVARDAPGPLGLLAGLAGAEGIGALDRARVAAWFVAQKRARWTCDPRATVAELLAGQPALVRDQLWYPLCVAALNTAPARASAQIFLNVLRETFGAGGNATGLVLPRAGLGELVPDAAARWLRAEGHVVRERTRTRIVDVDARGVDMEASGEPMRADAVVVAVGPHQLAGAFGRDVVEARTPLAHALATVSAFAYEPITTLYLGYDAPLALPPGLLRLEQGPGQWIFDRADILRRAPAQPPAIRALVSVVISASGPHGALDHEALVRAADAQLRQLSPHIPRLAWSQVIEEKRATYACVPGLVRPSCGALAERIYLCGDYTYDAFPATLEAAVRSGVVAARAALAAA